MDEALGRPMTHPTACELKWLVKSRSRTQEQSLKVHQLLRTKEWSDNGLKRAAMLTIGISFAMWRAVFLSPESYNVDQTVADGELFLEKIISNNAISFVDDLKWRSWSFGYYRNDARYRLAHMQTHLPSIVAKVEKRGLSNVLLDGAAFEGVPRDTWTALADVFDIVLETLEEQAPPRIASQSPEPRTMDSL